MCGIVGYIGKENAYNVLLNGLKRLEYRGYDSAGVALVNELANNDICVIKAVGKVKNLEEAVAKKSNLSSKIGIAHTRWATHGMPTEMNSHPHVSGDVTLVHNGIIENYIELKNKLIDSGVTFYSETDTEVAAATIANTSGKTNLERLINATEKMEGSYAFGVIFDGEKDKIYATRKDSPLIVALSDSGNYIASDVPSILDHTNKYILLEKDEYAKITESNITIYNKDMEEIKKPILTADYSLESAEKNDFEHFMLKEIYEQPDVLRRTFGKYKTLESLNSLPDIRDYDNIHIIACGSAMHAGLVSKYLIEDNLKIPVTVEIASEYRYKTPIIPKNTLAIIISQSGETADSLAALRLAKEYNAHTLSIVNVVGSSIARESDEVLYTLAGPEIAVATTKAYLSQVATLSLLTLAAVSRKESLTNDELVKLVATFEELQTLPGKIEEMLKNRKAYLNIANHIAKHNDIFFIGRNVDYALCMEGSLKLKEISYVHSEAYAAGELKHGTISLIEKGTPVIAISTKDALNAKTVSNIKEVKARGAFNIYITTENLNDDGDFYDEKCIVPNSSEFLSPLLTVIPLQLISYEVARMRNCDIDKPKNLAKSVTVE